MSRRRPMLAVALSVAALVIVPAAALGVQGDFFQPSTSPEAAGFATSVAAADLGGDSSVDLAAGNGTILLGDGSGNFSEPASSPETVGTGPASVVAANLGGDGNTDLAVANITSNDVTILIGDGTGNFTSPVTSPEGAGAGPVSVAAANLGGDANIDLAVANFIVAGTVQILIGDGTGNFTPAATSPEAAGNAPQSVAAANLNGDANIDLAVANTGSDNVTILLGDGTGNFTAAGTSPETVGPSGDGPASVAAANLGGSASIDLAVANAGTDNVTILIGDGTGNFAQAAGTTPEPAGDAPRSIAAAGLGGDANLDLAVANRISQDVTVMFGDGSGNFTAAPSSPEVTASGNEGIASANLGGTASIDLAAASSGSGISILLNDFVPPPVIPPVVNNPAPVATPPITPAKKCKKGQKLKKGKCVKKKRKKKK